MSDRKLDLGNIMEQALRASSTKVPHPLEQRVEQLEALLREAVKYPHARGGWCWACGSDADNPHYENCLVTRAKELLTSQPHEV
jgi:hypothetical protein